MAYRRKTASASRSRSGGYSRQSSRTRRQPAPRRTRSSRSGYSRSGGGTIRIVIEQPAPKTSPEDFIAGVGGTVSSKRKASM